MPHLSSSMTKSVTPPRGCVTRIYPIASDPFRTPKVRISGHLRHRVLFSYRSVRQRDRRKRRFHTQVVRPAVVPDHAEFLLSRDRPVGVNIWAVLNLLFC